MHHSEELTPLRCSERSEQRHLDAVDDLVQIEELLAAGPRDHDNLAALVVRVDAPFDERTRLEICESSGDIAAVNSRATAQVSLTHWPYVLERSEQPVVVAAQPFAVVLERGVQ